MKILMLKGLPASGKTTFAKELISTDSTFIRINKDDIRSMIYGKPHSSRSESLVLAIRDHIIHEAFSRGQNVIIDDTNFNERHKRTMLGIAKCYDAEVEEVFIDTPWEVCVKRDEEREYSVGYKVIKGMYNQYLRPEGD